MKVRGLINILSVIMIIWMAFSYFEIIIKNTNENPIYSDYNLIANMVYSLPNDK